MYRHKIFFTADTHFYHTNILTYCPNRRFVDVQEMNEKIIETWNNQVKPDDIVYHLGDFAFTNNDIATKLLTMLNGKIILVSGNHDTKLIKHSDFTSRLYNLEYTYAETKINKIPIILCHYPLHSWNKQHYGSFHLYGHTHGTCRLSGKCLDVGLDNSNKFSLWEWDEIYEYMCATT